MERPAAAAVQPAGALAEMWMGYAAILGSLVVAGPVHPSVRAGLSDPDWVELLDATYELPDGSLPDWRT